MSFYSPINRLAHTLPRPKGTGSEFMAELSKMPGYKTQEAEDRGLQALMNLPKMEREQFIRALKKKPIPPVAIETFGQQAKNNKGLNVTDDETHHEDWTLPGGTNYREILLKHGYPKQDFPGVEAHFGGEPNILASVRAKDRTGPNGEKILHIEELQSDWHQKGREHGYAKELTPEEEKEYRNIEGLPSTEFFQPKTHARYYELLKKREGVPDAPFKKNWHEMALKKMIHHAAANGYDSIAITPGAEQADRYGLAKHVSDIRYDPYYKQLIATGQRGEAINKIAEPHELPSYVGKDVAEKLLKTPISQGMHKLSGLDLESGGEGMKGFYDKMIPSFLNQFGKKYGAKVQLGTIAGMSFPDYLAKRNIELRNGEMFSSGFPLHSSAVKKAYEEENPIGHVLGHTFPITPAMREDVTKNGVPLYADGGSVEDEEPSKTVKAYKMFRVDKKQPGKLFPLFVDSNTPVEMDKWITAKEGERSTANTKKVKSKIGDLAYRPGWHAGDLPIATHIGDKDEEQKAEARRVRELRDAYAATIGNTKAAKALARKEHPYPSWVNAPRLRNPNHIWAEVEMPDDVNWQSEATKRGYNDQGKLIASQAHITDQLPLGGHYRYKTNSNMLGNWLIGGSMKVKRILHDKEVEAINKAAGAADLPRAKAMNQKAFGFAKGGTVGPDEWMAEEHVNHMADGGKVKPLSERFDFGKAGEFDPIGNAKKSLSGAYDVASKIPGNLKRLVTDPVAYAKSLPAPDIGQLAGAFNPAHIGGIMMGPGSRTWNQKSFEDAVNLAGSTGHLMPPEEVWKRTGNIPNARDFVPRQEINDSNAKFYTPAELKYNLDEAKAMLHWAKQQPLLPKWSTLPDEHRNNFLAYADKLNTVVQDLSQDPAKGIKAKYVLDHPELYAAYPELGEMLISQPTQPHPTAKGGFNSKRPEVTIFPQADPRGTAIHEMQHAVQDIEGMSPGTNPLLYGEDPTNYLRFHKAVTDAYPNLDPKEAAKDAMQGWYRSHMGEAEARQATERMDMSPQERLSNFPDYDVKPSWLIDKPAEAPNISLDPALKYERPASYAKGGRIKPIGYTKERVTVSPNLDAMNYELMSVKHYTKKAK